MNSKYKDNINVFEPKDKKRVPIKNNSEDSDGEGGFGNVNRLIMRPPGHSGKAKRGHLCFDASFETGNLGRVDLINDYEYDLFIRPDTCNPRFRFWFNFTVDNVKQDQKVIFNIVNISKYRNIFNNNLTPVVKSTTRPIWQRIPKEYVFYQRSNIHQGHYVLSFAFGFDKEDEVFQFALAPPYSYSKMQLYLSTIEARTTQIKRELLGKSVQKRRLDLITIGKLNPPESQEKKRVIVIIARVHAGESPSSFVCQGFLEFLISSHPMVSILREYVMFKIIPMLNPDGVFLGNYRTTVMGIDLNRSWNVATSWSHPTLKAALTVLTDLDCNRDVQLDFVLDIHANSSLSGCFIYGNTYEDVYRYERHIVFPKLLSNIADDYSSDNTMFNADLSKAGTARRYLCTSLSNSVNCYTFEVSIFGYHPKGSDAFIPYTEESYMRCGRNLVRTFWEYYQANGLIPINLTTEITDKKKRPKTQRIRKIRRQETKRPKTSRNPILLHFTDLNINYDSETSGEWSPTSRHHFSPHRQSDSFKNTKYPPSSPPPPTYIVLPQPSLSIIDFNLITRNGIEEAMKKNKN